jgi:hypothetical protein
MALFYLLHGLKSRGNVLAIPTNNCAPVFRGMLERMLLTAVVFHSGCNFYASGEKIQEKGHLFRKS